MLAFTFIVLLLGLFILQLLHQGGYVTSNPVDITVLQLKFTMHPIYCLQYV